MHKHGWPHDNDPPNCIEVGPTVCLRPTVHGGNPDIHAADGSIAGGPDEHLAGFIVAYDWPGYDHRLEGGVTVDPHFEKRWEMTGSLEGGDLTLSPSIQAYDDKLQPTVHGFIRNGKWEPA